MTTSSEYSDLSCGTVWTSGKLDSPTRNQNHNIYTNVNLVLKVIS
jgi:hypothetical protein